MMYRLSVTCLLVLILGCNSSEKTESAQEKIEELEKRIARIEADLYKVEAKSATQSKRDSPKVTFAPSAQVETHVVDTKIDAFLMQYLGFGDPIEKFPQKSRFESVSFGSNYGERTIPVLKKFKYFDKAVGWFESGQLYRVAFFAEFERTYSLDSVNQQVDKSLSEIADAFGLPSVLCFRERLSLLSRGKSMSSYLLCRVEAYPSVESPNQYRRGLDIQNVKLQRMLREKETARRSAMGEKLPDVK